MICPNKQCGYHINEEYDNKTRKYKDDGENFYHLEGHEMKQEAQRVYCSLTTTALYACPKCGIAFIVP